jgi:hypothetical protein
VSYHNVSVISIYTGSDFLRRLELKIMQIERENFSKEKYAKLINQMPYHRLQLFVENNEEYVCSKNLFFFC